MSTQAQTWSPDGDMDRMPPADLDAEQATLGGMMLSPLVIGEVARVIRPADHCRPAHQLVHEVITQLHAAGCPTDPVAVAAELTKRGEIARVGGAPYLHTLIASVPAAANAGYYALTVRQLALLRGLIEIATRALQKGYSRQVDLAEELVQGVREELDRLLADHTTGDGLESMADLMVRTLGELERPRVEAPGLKTGFADLDALLNGGLRGGQLICAAGRPAMGKTTVLTDWAREQAFKRGAVVQYHSLEMSRDELIRNMLAAEARVPNMSIRQAGTALQPGDWERIGWVVPRMVNAPLFLDDTPDVTVSDIELRFAELERSGHRPEIIFIDYLQLMRPVPSRRQRDNRQQEVSEMSRGLKLLAKKLDVPVVFAAQLNRGPEQRSDHRPLLADLRESGSLEQDCDIVLLLHREDAYEPESPRAGEADFIVAKHRNGPTATVTVAFQGHYSRFVDMARI